MIEEWKDIKGYEGLYQVSNLGRVKSLKFDKERVLKQFPNKHGYLLVSLCKTGKQKSFAVHRLVALQFIPKVENKPEVNHVDEDKTNNMVSNLEWCTRKENVNHGTRTEKYSKKVKAIDITNGEYNYYPSIRECGRQLGIDGGSVSKYLNGKVRHVGGYVFEYCE